jgi:hypothetical protein
MPAAQKGLEMAFDFCFEQSDRFRRLPAAARPVRVKLPTSLSTKVLLWNEMVAQKVLPAERARRDALAENSQNTA